MRRSWFFLLISVILVAPASAANKSSAMVIDANTGRVLHDKAGSEPRYPASLTKMMTLYLAFETIEAGRLQFSTSVPVSERAASVAPSKLGLDAGSEIELRDAIKALIVKSANDMAVAIAEKIAGSEDAFARLMTKRARQIGMRDTTFRNASGLPDPEQVTTARDMLTLAMRLQDDFPQHYRLFSTRSFSYGGKTYRSHNALLGRFPGVDGIKTGYTRASGFNLVSSYQAGGKHVVAAVFGGVSAGLRDAHMRMLLARAIETASTERTRKIGPQLVAEAKPAQRPNSKPVIKPEPAPKPKAAAVSVAQDEPEALADEASSVSVDDRQAPAPQIAIAKVKTVLVVAPSSTTEQSALDAPLVAEASASVVPHPSALTFASATPNPDFAALKAHVAARASSEPTSAEAGRAPDVAPPPAAPARDLETVYAKPNGPARVPSTLQAQLASFDTGTPNLSSPAIRQPALQAAVADLPAPMPVPIATGLTRTAGRVATSAPAPALASARAGYHVQIGVFGSSTEAERAMAVAKTKAADVLADSATMAMPITKGERQLFRARFAGFDSASATTACNELRRNGLDCFVARAN